MLSRCRRVCRRGARIVALVAFGLWLEPWCAAQSVLPAKLAAATAVVALTTSEIEALEGGRPVTRLLDAAGDDMVMFGAVWIDAPATDYLLAMHAIESWECGGGFAITKRLSAPPTVEDFSAMSLPDGDLRDLRSCRPGNCGVKLTAPTMEWLRRDIDWSSPAAADAAAQRIRQMAFSTVVDYISNGNSALGPYFDETRPTLPGQAFSEVVARMPVLSRSESELRRLLIEYPHDQLPDSSSFFYWQLVQFGLKPTIRINHVVTAEVPDHILVASKQLYASHYFLAALQIHHLIPDPERGRGFWLIDVSAARVDGLSGVLGSLLRGRVHSEALSSLAGGLLATKGKMERPQRARCSTGESMRTVVTSAGAR